MTRPTPPLLVCWEDFTKLLLETTEGFPKSARRTFSERLEGHTLDIYEELIRARFSRTPKAHVEEANLRLDLLRLLLRLSYQRKFVGEKKLRQLIEKIDEVGKMLGGWGKAEERR